ncbi:MAG: hypothetical protein ACOY0T_05050 [Myxococcota bacterium]
MRAVLFSVGFLCACGARSAADSFDEDPWSAGGGLGQGGAPFMGNGGRMGGVSGGGGAANGGAPGKGSGGTPNNGGRGGSGGMPAMSDKAACASTCKSIFTACPVPNSDLSRCASGCTSELTQLQRTCHDLQRAALDCINAALSGPSASCSTVTTALTSTCRNQLLLSATCR